jgi:hypothetical protein
MVTACVIVLRLAIPVESCLSPYSGVTYEPVPSERGGCKKQESPFSSAIAHSEAICVFLQRSQSIAGRVRSTGQIGDRHR